MISDKTARLQEWRLATRLYALPEIMTFERGQRLGAVCIGLLIFLSDAYTMADGLASTLYILVLVWLAEHRQRLAVLASSAVCILATAATYPLAHGIVPHYDPIFRRLVSCAAIILAMPVILNILRVRDEMLRQDIFLDLTNHPIIARDAGGIITYWNGAAKRLYGWSAREAIGKRYADLLSTQFPAPAAEIQAALKDRAYWEGQLVNRGKTGKNFTILSRWFSQAADRQKHTVLDIATDITALQHVTETLRLSEFRYRSIFNMVQIGLCEEDYSAVATRIAELQALGITDFERYCDENPAFVEECIRNVRIRDVNEAAMKIFEAEKKSSLLVSLEEVTLPAASGGFAKVIAAIANGAAHCTAAIPVRTLRGRTLSVIMSATLPASTAKMNSVLVSIIDDTARRGIQDSLSEAQESLLHVNQMTALGEMTATIAHQVNHPIAAIIANAEACRRWINRPEPNRQEAAEAIEAIARNGMAAAKVVAHIHALATHDGDHKAVFSIVNSIEDACRLLERELGRHHILLKREFAPAIRPVIGDRIQIEQVLLNLLTNAIEALQSRPDSREVTIRVTPHDTETILIQIHDNGKGIGAESMAKMFSPFFTTKHSGLGLGLAICRSIISIHHGKIWATSRAGQGATFQFTLPVASTGGLGDRSGI